MNKSTQYVVFKIEEQSYAVPLSAVERVVRAVEVTTLPKAPEIVSGIINVQGRIIPVINVRKHLHVREREIELNDQFIIANTSSRTVALIVDAVNNVFNDYEQEVVTTKEIIPGMERIEGVVKLKDGMLLIYDLDQFLSLEEEKELDLALK